MARVPVFRFRIILFLALIAALLPVDIYADRTDAPEGTYIFNSVTAFAWSADWTIAPDGHWSRWRVITPSCCDEWTLAGWYGYLPSLWIDYCLFCGQPGNATDEVLVWLRAPHTSGYVWSGAIIGWSSGDGWWSNAVCSVEWWPWFREEC